MLKETGSCLEFSVLWKDLGRTECGVFRRGCFFVRHRRKGLNRAVSCPEDEAKAKFLEAVSSGREPTSDKSWSSYRPNLMDGQDCMIGYYRSWGSQKGISS